VWVCVGYMFMRYSLPTRNFVVVDGLNRISVERARSRSRRNP